MAEGRSVPECLNPALYDCRQHIEGDGVASPYITKVEMMNNAGIYTVRDPETGYTYQVRDYGHDVYTSKGTKGNFDYVSVERPIYPGRAERDWFVASHEDPAVIRAEEVVRTSLSGSNNIVATAYGKAMNAASNQKGHDIEAEVDDDGDGNPNGVNTLGRSVYSRERKEKVDGHTYDVKEDVDITDALHGDGVSRIVTYTIDHDLTGTFTLVLNNDEFYIPASSVMDYPCLSLIRSFNTFIKARSSP